MTEPTRLGELFVMPNHVHLLASFASEDSLKAQCDSWLHYSARLINLAFGNKGKFWQQEPFDHLVRSPEQSATFAERKATLGHLLRPAN